MLIEDETWSLASIVIRTRDSLPARQLPVPAEAIGDVDAAGRRVRLKLRREQIAP